jgi:hypothetical protein
LYATVRWHIWQRVTGRWVTVTGKRRECDLLIYLLWCQACGSDLDLYLRRTHATRQMRERPGKMVW